MIYGSAKLLGALSSSWKHLRIDNFDKKASFADNAFIKKISKCHDNILSWSGNYSYQYW